MLRLKIIGPPGTGKTTRLLRIVEEKLEQGYMPQEIIYTSLTRAACNEVISRALQRFPYSRSDFINFRTEHSLCFKLIGLRRGQVFTGKRLEEFSQRYPRYKFSSNDNDDIEARFKEAMLKTVADYYEFFTAWMRNLLLSFEEAYRRFTHLHYESLPRDFNKGGLLGYLQRRDTFKVENGLWDFADMVKYVLDTGLFPEGAKVLIVDEAQDMSPLMWELMSRWAERVDECYIAGDYLQSIYQFSGASPELFLEFDAEEEVLDQSYRLPPMVKNYAKKIIEPTGLPFPEFKACPRWGTVERKTFYSIDWHNVTNAFLLVRTRSLINEIAYYFIQKGVPFVSERGFQSPLGTRKSNAFLTLVKLSEGEAVSHLELINLMDFIRGQYLERGAKTKIRKLTEGMYSLRDLRTLGFKHEFFAMREANFRGALADTKISKDEKNYLTKLYHKYGSSVFITPPKLIITTYHGAKGREADSVFLCPDYTTNVDISFHKNSLSERLLAYVGATRTRGDLIILTPRRNMYFPFPRVEEVYREGG